MGCYAHAPRSSDVRARVIHAQIRARRPLFNGASPAFRWLREQARGTRPDRLAVSRFTPRRAPTCSATPWRPCTALSSLPAASIYGCCITDGRGVLQAWAWTVFTTQVKRSYTSYRLLQCQLVCGDGSVHHSKSSWNLCWQSEMRKMHKIPESCWRFMRDRSKMRIIHHMHLTRAYRDRNLGRFHLVLPLTAICVAFRAHMLLLS
jgi:hypothetical protein